MAVDFPSSPTVGQTFTSGAQSWTWDGAKWVASGVYVGPPQFSNANRIINGDMRIDQRNNGASGTAGGYTIDRWAYGATVANKGAWGRQGFTAAQPIGQQGFAYGLGFTSSSAYTPASAEVFAFNQIIEADMVADFAWGGPNAQPVTLSFWAWCSLAGTFSGCVYNQPGPATRSYPFSYSLAASTWTKIIVTIPGDTAGTWVMSGNAGGVAVNFDLGSGATFRAPAGAWTNGNYRGANGAVNVVGTNGASFYVTGVKLEIGSIATPFNRKSMAESMADCQRYYQTGQAYLAGYASAAAQGFAYGFPPSVVPRAPGPWAVTIAANSSGNWTLTSFNYNAVGNFNCSGAAIAAGPVSINLNFNTGANAEL